MVGQTGLIPRAGWDEGILKVDGGMTLGEKATLTITGYVTPRILTWTRLTSCTISSDYAYGKRGFPDLIPPNSTLILYVHPAILLKEPSLTPRPQRRSTQRHQRQDDVVQGLSQVAAQQVCWWTCVPGPRRGFRSSNETEITL